MKNRREQKLALCHGKYRRLSVEPHYVMFGPQRGSARKFGTGGSLEIHEKLGDALSRLERRLEGRRHLLGGYTLADVAHAGNSRRLRELAEGGDVPLRKYPEVVAWMERVEGRESYGASA